jgi:hypothetical protein
LGRGQLLGAAEHDGERIAAEAALGKHIDGYEIEPHLLTLGAAACFYQRCGYRANGR